MLLALLIVLILGFVVFRFATHRTDAAPAENSATTGQSHRVSNSP